MGLSPDTSSPTCGMGPNLSEKQAMKELHLRLPKPKLTMLQLVALYVIVIGLSLLGVMLIWS